MIRPGHTLVFTLVVGVQRFGFPGRPYIQRSDLRAADNSIRLEQIGSNTRLRSISAVGVASSIVDDDLPLSPNRKERGLPCLTPQQTDGVVPIHRQEETLVLHGNNIPPEEGTSFR